MALEAYQVYKSYPREDKILSSFNMDLLRLHIQSMNTTSNLMSLAIRLDGLLCEFMASSTVEVGIQKMEDA